MTFAKITIQGRAGEDSVLRWTTNGKAVASVSIAVNKGPKEARRTIWFTAKAFGEAAEALRVERGQLVRIDGNLDVSSWIDKRTGEKRERFEVLIDTLSTDVQDSSAQKPSASPRAQAESPAQSGDWDADLPF